MREGRRVDDRPSEVGSQQPDPRYRGEAEYAAGEEGERRATDQESDDEGHHQAAEVVRQPHQAGGGAFRLAGPRAGKDRLPTPAWPGGLHLTSTEGAGEVQTPLSGPAAAHLGIGDRVWFRHAKAGELCERVDRLHLVRGDVVVDVVPTYRGEGRSFV